MNDQRIVIEDLFGSINQNSINDGVGCEIKRIVHVKNYGTEIMCKLMHLINVRMPNIGK